MHGFGCDSMDDFERFLTWLNPDREQAGQKYEDIRRKLIRFFICRGCGVDSEELTDETIDRVVKKIQNIADSYVGDPLLYCVGVARNVFREWLEKQLRIRSLRPPPPADSTEEKEQLDLCLQRCMKELTFENQDLILKYYTGDKKEKIENRKQLAEKFKIAPNALRIRAHRIRTQLRNCVEKCLAEENSEENDDETNHRNHH
jgi:DNA-directed RNA polymerase specialized sigma24 family protein